LQRGEVLRAAPQRRYPSSLLLLLLLLLLLIFLVFYFLHHHHHHLLLLLLLRLRLRLRLLLFVSSSSSSVLLSSLEMSVTFQALLLGPSSPSRVSSNSYGIPIAIQDP
jgi:hypothetical protein